VETNIKWPNNLLSGERKICGVLAEAIEAADGRAHEVDSGVGAQNCRDPSKILC